MRAMSDRGDEAALPVPVDRPREEDTHHPEAGDRRVEVRRLHPRGHGHRREHDREVGDQQHGRTPRAVLVEPDRDAVHTDQPATTTSADRGVLEVVAAVGVEADHVDRHHDAHDRQRGVEPVLDGQRRVGARRRGQPVGVGAQDAFFSGVARPPRARPAWPAPWPLGLLLVELLGLAGVEVDVLLPGEPHDLVHDLVGDRAQDVAVVLHPGVAGEVERLAEAHHRPGPRAVDLAGRGDDVGADDRARDHRRAGLQGQPGDAGLAAVELAVVGAGALGVDAEEVTLGEDLHRRLHRTLGGVGAGAVDRHLAGAGEELLLEPALDAGGREVLGLGDEGHPPVEGQRHEEPVGVRQVVARQDRGTLLRHVVDAEGLGPEDESQHGPEGDPLQEPIEHAREPSPAAAR